jgi:hypothetical protein
LHRFQKLLEAGSRELFEDNPKKMSSGGLQPTPNRISEDDLRLFFRGVEMGLITLERGARFNTLDRARKGGRWGLLSRGNLGGWYNAEYLPQVAAYVEAIVDFGYPEQRVFFELPDIALKIDLALLDNHGQIEVLGEAKRRCDMLDPLVEGIRRRYSEHDPGKEARNEARQLAWRLWQTRAPFLWLIGPGERHAYSVSYEPLMLKRLPSLPRADGLNLAAAPPAPLSVPVLRTPACQSCCY